MAFVALLDILGFKEISNRIPLDQLVGLLGPASFGLTLDLAISKEMPAPEESREGYVKVSLEKARDAPKHCEMLRFADTILLYRLDETPDALASTVWTTGSAIRWLMLKGLPLRGAITRGELYVSPDRSMYVGKSLIRAYELAQDQRWAGAIVDPECVGERELQSTCRILEKTRWLQRYPAPGRTLVTGEPWCVNWPSPDATAASIQSAMKAYNPNPDPQAQEKINETMRFVESVPRFDPTT